LPRRADGTERPAAPGGERPRRHRPPPTERCSLDDLTVSCLDDRLQRLECAAGVEVGAEDPDGHPGQPGEPFDGRHCRLGRPHGGEHQTLDPCPDDEEVRCHQPFGCQRTERNRAVPFPPAPDRSRRRRRFGSRLRRYAGCGSRRRPPPGAGPRCSPAIHSRSTSGSSAASITTSRSSAVRPTGRRRAAGRWIRSPKLLNGHIERHALPTTTTITKTRQNQTHQVIAVPKFNPGRPNRAGRAGSPPNRRAG
jgi:hypothetical protein